MALRRHVLPMAAACSLGLLAILPADLRAEQVQLRSYGQADGLDNLMVTAIAQDGDGYLWAGTQNGVYRFDGERFHRADRQTRLVDVVALLPDPHGGRWIGTADNLYHSQADAVQRLRRPDGLSLPLNGSADMAVDGAGTLWVLSDSRLYEVRRGSADARWEVAEALDKAVDGRAGPSLTAVAVDGAGTVWLACGTGLCRRSGRELVRVTLGGQGDAPEQAWTAIQPARDGSLWLRNARSIVRFDPGTSTMADQRLPGSATSINVMSPPIAQDPEGRILTAGISSVARISPTAPGRRWELFDRQHGMPAGGRFMALFVDREGSVWLSRAGSGLSRWMGYGRWEHWTRGDGLPHDVVWSVVRDSHGVLHAATSGGTARFDEQTRRFQSSPEMTGAHISALMADSHGNVWAGMVDGELLRRDGQPAAHYVRAAPDAAQAFRLLQGAGDRLWFAAEDGIGWWPGASGDLPLRKRTLVWAGSGAMDICSGPAGGLWAASSAGLLRISEAGAVSPSDHPSLQRYATSIACSKDGAVYVSDDHGRIFHVQPETTPPKVVEITPPLLADRSVLALLEDRRGWLWANTDAGVAVWNRRQWRLLDQSHGLIWNDTSSGGLFQDRDGTLWISTSQGLSHLLRPDELFSPPLAAVRIRSVLHGGRPLETTSEVRLKWSRAEALEVAIESPSFAERPAQAFEHRLLGFDDAWQRTGGSVIRYAALPAGNYTLQARLVDRQLGLASPQAQMQLQIDPPWWETWTFRLLCGALLASLAYAVHGWRLRAARQRERELAGLVAERTRELEASREELRERATKDGLTGAWNRRTVLEMLEHDVERSARDQQPLTVVLADIDHFKRINDELGHPAGDEVLRQFVARLRAVVRPYDAIGRYGGEEFVVLLRGLCVDQPEDRARVEAIRAAIADGPMMLGDGVQREVTCSFGAACARAGSKASPEDMIRQADEALYLAKRAGRNRVEYAGVAK